MKPPIQTLEARLVSAEGGAIELHAPAPGFYREAPREGALVRPGDAIGALEVLGVIHPLRAPKGALGVVSQRVEPKLARPPVDYGTRLFVLEQQELGALAADALEEAGAAHGGPVFKTPLGGRYYARPAPDAPPFVSVGDALTRGTAVAIIEVMKTFNRVLYDGEPATVGALLVSDGEDVVEGEPLLALEPK